MSLSLIILILSFSSFSYAYDIEFVKYMKIDKGIDGNFNDHNLYFINKTTYFDHRNISYNDYNTSLVIQMINLYPYIIYPFKYSERKIEISIDRFYNTIDNDIILSLSTIFIFINMLVFIHFYGRDMPVHIKFVALMNFMISVYPHIPLLIAKIPYIFISLNLANISFLWDILREMRISSSDRKSTLILSILICISYIAIWFVMYIRDNIVSALVIGIILSFSFSLFIKCMLRYNINNRRLKRNITRISLLIVISLILIIISEFTLANKYLFQNLLILLFNQIISSYLIYKFIDLKCPTKPYVIQIYKSSSAIAETETPSPETEDDRKRIMNFLSVKNININQNTR